LDNFRDLSNVNFENSPGMEVIALFCKSRLRSCPAKKGGENVKRHS